MVLGKIGEMEALRRISELFHERTRRPKPTSTAEQVQQLRRQRPPENPPTPSGRMVR